MKLDITVDERNTAIAKIQREFGEEAALHYIEKHYHITTGTTITCWVRVDTEKVVYKRTFHISDI